ncbi:MAG: FKBP-type peptidyl-prolyl cis-trans isomerase [Ghiorsea sp.]
MKGKLALAAVMAVGLTACDNDKTDNAGQAMMLDTEVKKFSYAMGMDVGQSLKGLGAEVDSDAFSAAISDVLADSELKLAKEESAKIKQAFFKKKQETQMAERGAAGAKNKAEGEAFLAENAKKDGVTVTASGLQYEVITKGKGKKPAATDTVKVHYEGTLINGDVFDSSIKRGQPISFPLNGVIKGWTEGVALMPVGSKYKLYIPSDLAYGERGAGAKIGANSTLIFTVELLAIEDKK